MRIAFPHGIQRVLIAAGDVGHPLRIDGCRRLKILMELPRTGEVRRHDRIGAPVARGIERLFREGNLAGDGSS